MNQPWSLFISRNFNLGQLETGNGRVFFRKRAPAPAGYDCWILTVLMKYESTENMT